MEKATPIPESLSGKFVGSFAYKTIKDRLPDILTKIIDHLCRQYSVIAEKHGEDGREQLKRVTGVLSRLRSRMMTNKALEPFQGAAKDVSTWNESLKQLAICMGTDVTYFDAPWLYVECYMYRAVQDALDCSTLLQELDPFGEQKQNAFTSSLPASLILFRYVNEVCSRKLSKFELKHCLQEFVKACLWGNKCDLSISAGNENFQEHDPLEQLSKLQSFILVDDSAQLADWLVDSQQISKRSLHVVLDNAGFELVTDLALAHFLSSCGLVSEVHFHAKCIPWFVSDVTPRDWEWTLQQLQGQPECESLVNSWRSHLAQNRWSLHVNDFWHSANTYDQMQRVAPELYEQLRSAHLVIFKGDLNYRKLAGDLKWDTTTPLSVALRGFQPTSLLALRTLKCDLAVGLEPGQAEAIEDADWMTSGQYGVVQFLQ